MLKLKPCPFCGAKMPIVRYIATDGHAHVFCYKLAGGCGALTLPHVTIEEAVEAWNTRASGWIPCSDGLPETHKDIIFFAHNKFVCFGKYRGLRYQHHTWESGVYTYWDDEVTHWMPLPEPPEMEEENE